MGWQKWKAFGIENSGKCASEVGPPGPAVCKSQGNCGVCGSGPRWQCIQKPRCTSERQNHWSRFGNPGVEVSNGRKGLADRLGYAIGGLACGKPTRDTEDIFPKPSTDAWETVWKDTVGFAARGAAVNGNQDDFGGKVCSLSEIMIMGVTFWVVAEGTGYYL